MKFLLALLLLSFSGAQALDLPAGGADVRGDAAVLAGADAAVGTVESLKLGKRITIMKADPARAFSAQFTAGVSAEIGRGDRVLAVIKASMFVASAAPLPVGYLERKSFHRENDAV